MSCNSNCDSVNVYLIPFPEPSDISACDKLFVNVSVTSISSTNICISSSVITLSKKFVSTASNIIDTCLFSWSINGLTSAVYWYLIVGFIKSTILFLNAVYFGVVSLSPMSVSTHSGFPTNISVTLFPFPDVSLIVFSAISIFTWPSYVPKSLNVR